MTSDWREAFRDPGPEHRGAPFWAWNGKLEAEELRRQVRDMKQHGMGGFFMHSRPGLETPYLSREWIELTEATIDEAKSQGMLAWLYDEDRWPSGAAGGLVTELHPEYRGKSLVLRRLGRDEYLPDAHTVKAFTAKAAGEDVIAAVSPLAADAPSIPKGTEALLFSVVTQKESGWQNGGAYLDTLDPAAVGKFLDVTLTPYRNAAGVAGEFGGAVPGIFTDEPNFSHGRNSVPWTPRLPEVFRERYGYDITGRLPELFCDVEGADPAKPRRDFWDCVTHMFVEAFTRPYFERCEELGLDLTGHYLAEETLASQTRVAGAAMRHYEFMHSPGIDILREATSEVLTVKQCSSAARQFGRSRVLSELYGASGWDFTFEAEKWVGDWQIALGVNYRCQHLAWYTMARNGKRDYPPCFNYQSASWKHHKATEDYFARLTYMLTRGEAEREVLLLHPIESFWATHAALREPKGELDRQLVSVMTELLQSHHDFDLGDEDILARHAAVEGSSLRVGKALYRAVVVPPAVTWRGSTLDLLERFADAGGAVVAVHPAAPLVGCEASGRLKALVSRKRAKAAALDEQGIALALDEAGVRTVSVASPDGTEIAPLLVQRRAAEGRTILFIANTDRKRGYDAEVTLSRATGGAEDWDLRTADARRLPCRELDGTVRFRVSLPPTGSKVLVVGPDIERPLPGGTVLKDAGKIRLARKWKHARDEMNARILDKCRYSLDDEPLSRELPVWVVEREVRARTGLPPNASRDVQPWKLYRDHMVETGRTLEMRFGFRARVKPARAAFIVMERPRDFEVELNGKRVTSKPRGWFIDREFRMIDVKGRIVKGANEIVLRTKVRTDTGIEQMYIAGDFGVDARHSTAALDLVAEPKELKTGDWTKQGYAQYTGSMFLRQSVQVERKKDERLFLSFGPSTARAPAATCVAVKVNKRKAGLVPWPPYEVEVTGLVKKGRNEIEIEVVPSRRNLFGPLHLREVWPGLVGPWQFQPTGDGYFDGYTLAPAGILGDVSIVRRREA